MLVVVVLPCIPAMAMPNFSRISSASISARWMTGILRARASSTSGLSLATAELVTTTSLPATFSAAWPINHRAQSGLQAFRRGAGAQVRARDRIAHGEQDLGDTAHANAADAEEVDAVRRRKQSVDRRTHLQPLSHPPLLSARAACRWPHPTGCKSTL
jgi:hypothetical protein